MQCICKHHGFSIRIDIHTYLQFSSGTLLSDCFQQQFIYLMVNFSPKCLLDFRHQLLVCLLDRRASIEFCGVVWRFAAVAHSIDDVILGGIQAPHVTFFCNFPKANHLAQGHGANLYKKLLGAKPREWQNAVFFCKTWACVTFLSFVKIS